MLKFIDHTATFNYLLFKPWYYQPLGEKDGGSRVFAGEHASLVDETLGEWGGRDTVTQGTANEICIA